MNFEHTSETVVNIYNYLSNIDVCLRCILRYLGAHIPSETSFYKNPNVYFEKHGIIFSNDENLEVEAKKIKKNPCPVCLDCFDDIRMEKIAECIRSSNISEYNSYNDFFLNISWPKCLLVRTFSLYLHLKEKFPDISFCSYFDNEGTCLENLGRIFRGLAADKFSSRIDKMYHPKSHLSILINLGYENDEQEIANLKKFDNSSKKSKKDRSKNNANDSTPSLGRNIIPGILKDITTKQFKDNFPIPPVTPEKEVFVESITVTADPLYLGGRYLKFSRVLCQTPWIIDGKSVTENNLQEVIFDGVCSVLKIDKKNLTFCASGREDVDVRMLGTGRPFYVKIDDPKNRHVSAETCRKIESEIVKTKLAAVISLQPIFVQDIQTIKLGEEVKNKWYKAVCHTECPDLDEAFAKIQKFFENPVEVRQKTPVRVLHRRTLMDRKKLIYKLNISKIKGRIDLFELDVQTQAGTYIKEFVNGDFNRTVPNLASVIGHPTDLIALDCTSIDLEWPLK